MMKPVIEFTAGLIESEFTAGVIKNMSSPRVIKNEFTAPPGD